jgi:DNA-binding response OmpR family regulator
MRVLIANGDEAFLTVAQYYLSHHGHEVKIAKNGLESFAILRRYVPDVVVLERELLWGGSDGVRALMKQEPRWSEIPVILTSDNVLTDESNAAASPSLAAQLQKPYRLEDLIGHLQACRDDSTRNPA